MTTTKLRIKNHGPIREIQLNRPEVHNAFDAELIARLEEAFLEVAADCSRSDELRGVLLTAEGKSFCAGADLHYMKEIASFGEEENQKDAQRLSRMFQAVHDCPVFVLARIQGAALGGGSGLVAAVDFALAAETAKFGFTEARLGIIPAVISPFVLARIGSAKARAYFPTGQIIPADEAERIGLVDRVVPPLELDAEVNRICRALLTAGPIASREAKRLANDVGGLLPLGPVSWPELREMTSARIASLRGSPEGQEGMGAFFEKRPARWVEMPKMGDSSD